MRINWTLLFGCAIMIVAASFMFDANGFREVGFVIAGICFACGYLIVKGETK